MYRARTLHYCFENDLKMRIKSSDPREWWKNSGQFSQNSKNNEKQKWKYKTKEKEKEKIDSSKIK